MDSNNLPELKNPELKNIELDIIIPVYNEAENITRVFDHLLDQVKAKIRILICYDFEQDNTLPAIKNYPQNIDNIKLIKNQSTGPLGAIITGFKQSTAPYVLVYPADDFINGNLIDQMLAIGVNGADIICPSRFMPGGYMKNCSPIKAIIMRSANFLLYHIVKIGTKDASNGFRMFSRRVLNNINIESTKGFAYSIELLVKAHRLGYTIKELPAKWIERTTGQSRFKVFAWLNGYLRWFIYAFASVFHKKID
jgi:glycosyltransferase involved in cell wall biosynthesis